MSAPHDPLPHADPPPEKKAPEAPPPGTPVDRIAIDVYGIKTRFNLPLADPEDPPAPPAPVLKSDRAVWRECAAHLQAIAVGLVEFLAEIPRTATVILRSLGRVADSGAELARRVARGRARADHREDEAIARNETAPPVAEPQQEQSESKAAMARLVTLQEQLQARGHTLPVVQMPNGVIVFLPVPIDAQRAVMEHVQEKLLEHTPAKAPASDDAAPASFESLPTRVRTALAARGITSAEQVGKLTLDEAAQIPGIGPKALGALWPFLLHED